LGKNIIRGGSPPNDLRTTRIVMNFILLFLYSCVEVLGVSIHKNSRIREYGRKKYTHIGIFIDVASSIHLVEDTLENSKIFLMLFCCMLINGPIILDSRIQNNHNMFSDGANLIIIRKGITFCILRRRKKLFFLKVIVIITIHT